MSTSEKFEFQLIQEKPLSSNDSLEFGHSQIISTLKNIVTHNNFNLTIGLFGGWGTGKSSIVESLKDDLVSQKIPLIVFDVWKHEGDALRRTFLKELDQQLSSASIENLVREKNIISDRVSNSISESLDKYEFSIKKIAYHFGILFIFSLAFIVPAIILYNLFNWIFDTNIFKEFSVPALSSLIVTALTGGLLFKYVDSFIKIKKIDTKKDRLQDPYEFELEFKKLINNLTNIDQKLVITFDNLDRVSGENALNIISTIKTFLDFAPTENTNQHVYFLIPCDILAMKNHLNATLKVSDTIDKEMYIDEFLRKFFNTSIWIPEFYHTELESFANAKLKETKVKAFENDLLAWLIIRVFHDNPRQIIQFINILVSNFILLKQFCESNEFADENFYSKNVPQLAKFLLLKQRHPDIIEQYRKMAIYNLYHHDMLARIKDEAFKSLLAQTEDISIPSMEPFFKYRSSAQEQAIPGIGHFIQKMIEEDEKLLSLAKEIGISKNIHAFFNVVLNHWIASSNGVFRIKFINHLLSLCEKLDLTCPDGILRTFLFYICGKEAIQNIYFLNPTLVNRQILKKFASITQANKENITKIITYSFLSEDNIKGNMDIPLTSKLEMTEFILDNLDYLDKTTLDLLSTAISDDPFNPMFQYFFLNSRFSSGFISNETLKKFCEPELIEKSIGGIYYQVSVIRSLEPKHEYVRKLILLYNSYWDFIFSEEQNIMYPNLVKEMENILIDIIFNYEDLPEQKDSKEQASLIEIIQNTLLHIDGFPAREFMKWIPAIEKYIHIKSVKKLLQQVLSDQFERLCLKFSLSDIEVEMISYIAERVQLTSVLLGDEELMLSFSRLYVKSSQLRDIIFENLGIEMKKSMIANWIIEDNLGKMYNTILEFSKEFTDDERIDFLSTLALIFIDKVKKQISLEEIKKIGSLIIFFSEKKSKVLEVIKFENCIAELLIKFSDSAYQQYGYTLLNENKEFIGRNAGKILFKRLRTTLQEDRQFSNYLIQEAIILLGKKFELISEEFITFVLDQILINSRSFHISGIYSDILTINIPRAPEKYHQYIEKLSKMLQDGNWVHQEYMESLENVLKQIYISLLAKETQAAENLARKIHSYLPNIGKNR